MKKLRKHNVMLFPSGKDKMLVTTIMDREFFDKFIEESERDKIHFVVGTSRNPIMSNFNPTTNLDMGTIIEGREWGDKCGVDHADGHSISTLLMSPVWFCEESDDPFENLM